MAEQPVRRRRHSKQDRGFVLVLAAMLVLAITAMAIAVLDTAGTANLSQIARRQQLAAEQMAEFGLTRGMRDAELVSPLFSQWDFDMLLDPNDNTAENTSEKYSFLPRKDLQAGAGGATIGGWGAGTETVNGLRYRKVVVGDSAYLVRYDDNRDDMLEHPEDTTNNTNNNTEGPAVGDNPLRDRDQAIVITAIGLAGGTTYATAPYRHTLRATLRATGGKGVITNGSPLMGNNGVICGNGALFCGDNTSTLSNLKCFCGDIKAPSFPSGFEVGTPRKCLTTECNECAPQSLTEDECRGNLEPADPPVPTFKNAIMNNFAQVAGMCYFYIKEGNPERLFIWDHSVATACTSTSPTDNLIEPDNDTSGPPSFPKDCWVRLGDVDVEGENFELASGFFRPGRYTAAAPGGGLGALYSAGHIIPSTEEYARRTNLTDLAWVAITTGLHRVPKTWAGLCGCSSCGDTATGVRVYHEADEFLRLVDSMPKGYYYIDMDGNDDDLRIAAASPGASTWYQVAIVANLKNNYTVTLPSSSFSGIAGDGANNVQIQNPLGVLQTSCDAKVDPSVVNRFALVTDENISVNGNGAQVRYGMWAGGNISWGGQNGFWGGRVVAGGNLAATGTNAAGIAGGCPDPACPNLSEIWVKGNASMKNSADFCANVRVGGDMKLWNSGTVKGTIWTGGNLDVGNGLTVNPLQVTGTMLGSVPIITGVQAVRQ